MPDQTNPNDPVAFLRSLWGSSGIPVPGLVTPTLDIGELDKRIADLKAVEGWLKMNLGMLQIGIQGLEMQRTTLTTLQAVGQSTKSGESIANHPFFNPPLWPWNLMPEAPGQDAQGGREEASGKKEPSPE